MSRPLSKFYRKENETPALPIGCVLISSLDKFRDCKGYAIHKNGIVYTCKAHNFKPYYYDNEWRILKPKMSKLHGYWFIIMSNFGNDVTAKIHTLIAHAFMPNPNNFPVLNHIDGNKGNNSIDNLEWCTQRHNAQHCIDNNLRNTAKGEKIPNSKIKSHHVANIFKLKQDGYMNKEIAKIYDIDPSAISRILNKKAWAHACRS